MHLETDIIIGVAPNGAKLMPIDHPNLPLTANHLAETAIECLAQGARMFHLHVRNEHGQHSIDKLHYQPAINLLEETVGDQMMIQVTSESAGLYSNDQQMRLMLDLQPKFVSIAIREYIRSPTDGDLFSSFINKLYSSSTVIQYILYDNLDYQLYCTLLELKLIPSDRHSTLVVLGRYFGGDPELDILQDYEPTISGLGTSMLCTFGPNAPAILLKATELGQNIRLGFENGCYLSDGTIAESNAQLISDYVNHLDGSRKIAGIDECRKQMGDV